MQQACIFCKIISHEIPAKIIARTEDLIVIEDIAPKAPIHYLIIPLQHIHDIASLAQSEAVFGAKMLIMAQQLSVSLADSQSFRLIMNNGRDAGQTVFHMHVHFLSGKPMLDL